MKKAVCVVLTLVLALALTGCGSKSYTFDDGPKTGSQVASSSSAAPSSSSPQYLNSYVSGGHFLMDAEEFRDFYNGFAIVPMKEYTKSAVNGFILYDFQILESMKITLLCNAESELVESIVIIIPASEIESGDGFIIPSIAILDHIVEGTYYSYGQLADICGMENTENGYRSGTIDLNGSALYVSYSVYNEEGRLAFSCLE